MSISVLKNILSILLVSLLFVQCAKENRYLIEKGKVGFLSKETTVLELNTIFESDSIVSNLPSNNSSNGEKLFSVGDDEYEIFSVKGEKLLEISPVVHNDSLSKIKSIQIFDRNYKTDKGISLQSTFKDINENYLVNKVETTLTSATLFIDELNATISIDKKDLGISSFSRDEVSIDQIPDIAKIKYFTIWFN
ncbi:MAG: hypothetical protein HKP59_06665 [Lutibacter sp.]|uniref:hypothetical protein n=1 Tax=Lutibacter sp. TaxID=1925666 RepID=UPI001815BA94|nr:hypothetical protein [Lutibacter sp.]MBT8317289.1 hypothetical protein [Lutibacter sp.]NNJ58148.1 hypothetical protein [Lutibacter sp.]